MISLAVTGIVLIIAVAFIMECAPEVLAWTVTIGLGASVLGIIYQVFVLIKVLHG